MDGRMKEQQPKPDNIAILRRWITWAAVIGTGLWTGYFFAFLVYHSLAADPDTENWFLRMVQAHPAATIGLAMSAISAFCLVALLEIARGPIEFEALGFKFKGASGPAILWVFCFLAMIFGVWLLWDKSGSIEIASETVSGANVNALNTALQRSLHRSEASSILTI